jgi:hypothetical protein
LVIILRAEPSVDENCHFSSANGLHDSLPFKAAHFYPPSVDHTTTTTTVASTTVAPENWCN